MKHLIASLFLVVITASCSKTTDPCAYDPCAISAPASEVAAVETYLATNAITATKHCSGYYFIIDAAGSGSAPFLCSNVAVKYKGQLTNGVIFDQSGANPVSFQLSRLIEAWKKALMQIGTNGKMRIYVPPSLAYGSQDVTDNGVVVIPANSILIFEIELVAVS